MTPTLKSSGKVQAVQSKTRKSGKWHVYREIKKKKKLAKKFDETALTASRGGNLVTNGISSSFNKIPRHVRLRKKLKKEQNNEHKQYTQPLFMLFGKKRVLEDARQLDLRIQDLLWEKLKGMKEMNMIYSTSEAKLDYVKLLKKFASDSPLELNWKEMIKNKKSEEEAEESEEEAEESEEEAEESEEEAEESEEEAEEVEAEEWKEEKGKIREGKGEKRNKGKKEVKYWNIKR